MNIGSTFLSGDETDFTVWAPLREKMILHIVYPADMQLEMEKDSAGYFHVRTLASPGCRYFFMPGGKKDLPDPASRYQPAGVHGPSEVIDPIFPWADVNWKGIPFDELILYELHTGTFTGDGTFEAIIAKLDHLVSTGINALQLMPVAQFPGGRNWGYDGVFPYAVQNTYGGPTGLKKLVDACHAKGLAIFLDVVYNHLGPEGNCLEEFGPYFTDHYQTPWGKAVNFDGSWSDGVRDFFSDNALYWFEDFHIDGLRFDAVHEVYDMGAVHFWQLLHQKTARLEQRLGRSLHTIAESDFNDPRVTRSPDLGGYGFTAQWLDDFHHALYALVDVEGGQKLYADFGSMDQLAKAYKDGFVHSGDYVHFRKRKFGKSSAGIDGDKFVVFIDNHDQAGNRLTGSCLSSLISFERIKLTSAAYLFSPYVPMLFMGEEYGDDAPFYYFISHGDEELIKLVREGRKKDFGQFGWDSEPPDPFDERTFYLSKRQWDTISHIKHDAIHRWYRELIHLRKTHGALKKFDKNSVGVNIAGDMLHLQRRAGPGEPELMTLINFSETSSFPFTTPASSQEWSKVIDSNDENWTLVPRDCRPTGRLVLAGEQILIPPLTVVAYSGQSPPSGLPHLS